MSEKNQFVPFCQVPVWADEQKFEITGSELRAIQKICEDYTRFIPIVEGMFGRFLNDESIKVKYEDLEGNPITKEDVKEMFEKFVKLSPEGEPQIG